MIRTQDVPNGDLVNGVQVLAVVAHGCTPVLGRGERPLNVRNLRSAAGENSGPSRG